MNGTSVRDCCRNFSVHLRNPVLRPNNARQSHSAWVTHTLSVYLSCWKKLENQHHMQNTLNDAHTIVWQGWQIILSVNNPITTEMASCGTFATAIAVERWWSWAKPVSSDVDDADAYSPSFCGFYKQGDSDVISLHIYAIWFSPPSCG